MRIFCFLILLFISLPPAGFVWGGNSPGAAPAIVGSLTEAQWANAVAKFEISLPLSFRALEREHGKLNDLQAEISKLEDKIASLRRGAQGGGSVFDEIRLKNLLNDLKSKLEEQSNLQRDLDTKQKDFEQQALSLISLYNEKIERELETAVPSSKENGLDAKAALLTSMIQKRNHTQTILAKYQKKPDEADLLSVERLGALKNRDRESLQLTLDLCRDRKKDLEERLERWALEKEEIRSELKLQGKMQEFLEDIHQLSEDTDAPHGGMKDSEMESLIGKSRKNKMEARLAETQKKIERAQDTLSQIKQLMANVQRQMQQKSGEKRK